MSVMISYISNDLWSMVLSLEIVYFHSFLFTSVVLQLTLCRSLVMGSISAFNIAFLCQFDVIYSELECHLAVSDRCGNI